MAEKKASVLIVDDNAVVREVLRGMVNRDEKLTVIGQAATGESAIDLVKSLKPDLVCLDVMLPGVDGLEVLRAIRAINPEIRVILVTGHSTSDVVGGALKSGANGFVVKPFNANKLLQTIHSALAAPASPAPAAEPDAPAAEPGAPAAAPAAPAAEAITPAADPSAPAAEPKPPTAA